MPHVFKVQCYLKHIVAGKAAIGDTVYLKSRPDMPMTVTALPHWNRTADPRGPKGWVKTIRVGRTSVGEVSAEGQIVEEWAAEVLSL